jgi:hypothetical protein
LSCVSAWLVVHCLVLRINCSWFEVESHCLFSVLIAGWYALLQAGRFYCDVSGVVVDIQLGVREGELLFSVGLLLGSCYEGSCRI